MKRFTMICKGNKIRQFDYVDGIMVDDEIIVMDSDGKIIVDIGNPITWPADATSGMQAIVDVKAGTLRFAYDGWPRAVTEFVVSEYVTPVTSAPHIFDVINYWPEPGAHHPGAPGSPEGWYWKWFGDDWVLSNGTIGLVRDDWVKYKLGDLKPAKSFGAVEDCPVDVVGTKHDHGKPILGAVPPHAELAVGRVLTFGAEKYARGNWDKVEDHENRYMDAALRHLNAHRRGELTDSESGESHLAHAACCILFMLDKQERS